MSRWIRCVLTAIVAGPVVLLAYGTLIEPRFVRDVRRLEATRRRLTSLHRPPQRDER